MADVAGVPINIGLGNINILLAVYWAIIFIVIFSIVGFIVWFAWWTNKYRHRVMIKEVARGRTLIHHDRARNFKARDGNIWWKLWYRKDKLPEPPSECVELTRKGKKWCAFYYSEEMGYVPIQDTNKYEDWKMKLKAEGFEPFTPQHRAILINEMTEAADYKKKSLADLLAVAVPSMTFIVMLALLLIFWGKVVEPFGIMGDKLATVADKIGTAIDKMDSYESRLERVEGSSEFFNSTLPPAPPN